MQGVGIHLVPPGHNLRPLQLGAQVWFAGGEKGEGREQGPWGPHSSPAPQAVREPPWQPDRSMAGYECGVGAGDIKDDSTLLLRREVSRASQIGFRNPRPQINSDAQEFIKEARQSASEKTHVPSPAKPRGRGRGVQPEGREQSGNRTRVPSEDVASTAPVPTPLGARPGS